MKSACGFSPRSSCAGFALVIAFALVINAHGSPRDGEYGKVESKSGASRLVAGPSGPINQAVAAGATAVITLQPVPPKTQPASSYPPGSSIVNQTLTLNSVPARIWVDVLITGWAPESLNTAQVTISATDIDMDGGGYSGASSNCAGTPVFGAGDLAPAMQPCGAICDNRPEVSCLSDQDCRVCTGGANDGIVCTSGSDCPGGTCPSLGAVNCNTSNGGVNIVCRNEFSGLSVACIGGEPSRCVNWNGVSPGSYFPSGRFCEPGFQDRCSPTFVGSGVPSVSAVDLSTYDHRFAFSTEPGFEPFDFEPSYLGTFVLDAPANARGTYTIDIEDSETFLQNPNFAPGNNIPMAVLNSTVIETPCSPQADATGIAKTRFISFTVPSNLADMAALRVTLLSLHHVEPPYAGGPSVPFTAFEFGANCAEAGGCVRWVGPPVQYEESTASATPFYAATLQCTPHYQDWSTVGLLHVTGSAITPSSLYEVQSVDQTCAGNEANCTAVSGSVSIATTRWGDVELPYNPPSDTVQPDVADIGALVNKFRSAASAPIKARGLLAGSDAFGNISPATLDADFDFSHISACVDAFRGRPYPYTIQACP